MKIIANSLLLLGFCFLSVNSFAATNLDIVKELYENGTGPAAAEDFPERNFGTNLYVGPPDISCVIIDGTDQPNKYNISRTIRNTPAQGPLLPEKIQKKLVFGNSRNSYNLFPNPEILTYNMCGEPETRGIDLTVTNPMYRSWMDGDSGTNFPVPATLFVRKSGKYIAFKISVDHKPANVQDENFYGYCYSNESLALF